MLSHLQWAKVHEINKHIRTVVFMSFFEELKRRNVFRVGIAYAISAWILLQVVDLVLENIDAPPLVMQVLILGNALPTKNYSINRGGALLFFSTRGNTR
jgi:hypothetical protein